MYDRPKCETHYVIDDRSAMHVPKFHEEIRLLVLHGLIKAYPLGVIAGLRDRNDENSNPMAALVERYMFAIATDKDG